ncbi:MAG: hypothetical protein NUV51_03565 [Sulfuricaulis sp.]|nr:hypothetical protein [Sulfuricaulis sp.]
MKPARSILDKNFRYTTAAGTDVAATFRRIRRELAEQQKSAQQEVTQKVRPIKKGAK